MLKPQFRQTDAKASTAVDSGVGVAMLLWYTSGFSLRSSDLLIMGAGVALTALAVFAF